MAVIGTWGNVVFSVSRQQIRTFTGLKKSGAAKYATHDRHLKKTLLERTGTDAESLSFDMFFSAYLGVNPMNALAELESARDAGKVAPLIVGGRRIGKSKWVLQSLSESFEEFGKGGSVTVAKASVSMKEYAGR